MKLDKNVFNWVRGHESALLHHFDTVSHPPLLRFLFKTFKVKTSAPLTTGILQILRQEHDRRLT